MQRPRGLDLLLRPAPTAAEKYEALRQTDCLTEVGLRRRDDVVALQTRPKLWGSCSLSLTPLSPTGGSVPGSSCRPGSWGRWPAGPVVIVTAMRLRGRGFSSW